MTITPPRLRLLCPRQLFLEVPARLLRRHAAPPRPRIHPHPHSPRTLDEPLQQRQIHPAHQRRKRLRHRPERAVPHPQHRTALVPHRLIPARRQHPPQPPPTPAPPPPPPHPPPPPPPPP